MSNFILILISLIISTSTLAIEKQEQNTLKAVMQRLGVSMEQLTKGILHEDYSLIKQAAFKIANHPKPKSQLSTIVKTLGFGMLKFKSFDGKVHDPAVEIVKLADKGDLKMILKNNKKIITNCVACHSEFKKEVSKALFKR
jgi:cytochrome c556